MLAPIYVTLKSNGARLMVFPTLETIGTRYITCIFPNDNYPKNTFTLQNVRRERVRFRKEDISRFVNWETSVLRDNRRLARFAIKRMEAESVRQQRDATAKMIIESIDAGLATLATQDSAA